MSETNTGRNASESNFNPYAVSCDPQTGLCTARLQIPLRRAYAIPQERICPALDALRAASPHGLYLGYGVEAQIEANEKLRTAMFVASTPAADRFGDVIEQDGWQLDNYRRNPIVLFGHDSRALPVARGVAVGTDGGRLMLLAQFATAGQYEFADVVFRMILGGFISAVSVGFIPLEYDWIEDPENPERRSGKRFLRNELLEISVVAVPANPEALIVGRSFLPALQAVTVGAQEMEALKTNPLGGVGDGLPCAAHYILLADKAHWRARRLREWLRQEGLSPRAERMLPEDAAILSLQEGEAPARLPKNMVAWPLVPERFWMEAQDGFLFTFDPDEGTLHHPEATAAGALSFAAWALVLARTDGQEVLRRTFARTIEEAALLAAAWLTVDEAAESVTVAQQADAAVPPVYRALGVVRQIVKAKFAVQTTIFAKAQWTPERARTWLRAHGFRSDKVDETSGSYRFRQFDPEECVADTFATLTQNLPAGLSLVVCHRKGGGKAMEEKEICTCTEQAGDIADPVLRTVVPFQHEPLAARGAPWDAAKEMDSTDDPAAWRRMSTVVDGDPKNKTSYKLPHHRGPGGSYATVLRGVGNALARLNQTQMPAGDRSGARAHLLRHRAEFEKGFDVAGMDECLALLDAAYAAADAAGQAILARIIERVALEGIPEENRNLTNALAQVRSAEASVAAAASYLEAEADPAAQQVAGTLHEAEGLLEEAITALTGLGQGEQEASGIPKPQETFPAPPESNLVEADPASILTALSAPATRSDAKSENKGDIT